MAAKAKARSRNLLDVWGLIPGGVGRDEDLSVKAAFKGFQK